MFDPFGTGEAGSGNHTSSWRPEPRRRGTYGIFSTCLVTMVLCIWTAVHLNMPEQRGFWKQIRRKMGWLVIGLFAPELVAWIAFQQNRDARKLTKEMQKLLGQNQRTLTRDTLEYQELSSQEFRPFDASGDTGHTQKRQRWTMVHSQYALMGGFAMMPSLGSVNFLPEGIARLTMTYSGLRLLATYKPALVPNLSRDEIQDKSKASSLAKTIVCMQASWFCVQCITRVIQGLAISLLELNTFAHAICTLLIYVLWWHKPLDVQEPILIQDPAADGLLAMLVMRDVCGQGGRLKRTFYRGVRQTAGYAWLVEQDQEDANVTLAEVIKSLTSRANARYLAADKMANPKEFVKEIYTTDAVVRADQLSPYNTESSRVLHRDRAPVSEEGPVRLFEGNYAFGFRYEADFDLKIQRIRPFLELTVSNLLCWKLASQARAEHGVGIRDPFPGKAPGSLIRVDKRAAETNEDFFYNLARRVGEWPSKTGSIDQDGLHLHDKSILVGFILAGLIYGAMHLLAWDAPFPSAVEKVLWRGSGVILAASGVILTIQYSTPNKGNFFTDMLAGLSFALEMFLAVFYVAARVYLVVECFINLAHLPDKVFDLPNWSPYFPHIS